MIKRYSAELIGTFVIVFAPVAAASSGSSAGGGSGLLVAALASGLPVLAMIYALGPISAAHFNPAVTLGFAIAKRFPWRFVALYWAAQFMGATLAAVVAFVLFGTVAGAHVPADPSAVVRNIGMEAVLGFILMFVIAALATDRRVSSAAPPIAIGLTVVTGVLIGGPVTGGSMNPARSFGPALFVHGALAHYWVYALGPCVGAGLAALIYEAIRLQPEHAKGAPEDLFGAQDARPSRSAV